MVGEINSINFRILNGYLLMMIKLFMLLIVESKSNAKHGEIVPASHGKGNQTNPLNCLTDIIIHEKNYPFIISDWGNRRIMR
jgi:hypothetical protein